MLSIKEIFQSERTCYQFLQKDISDEILKEIYDIMKMGPTSANSCPLRLYFVKSKQSKEKLMNCLMPGNVTKTKTAPVTVIFAYDVRFYEQMEELFPHNPQMISNFAQNEDLAFNNAFRNSTLQAAYFMMVARSFGLSCGPMSGFDNQKLDNEFFQDTSLRSNFLCNIGYQDPEYKNPPRLARLSFERACKII